jgi:putative acid phosphatase of HAD superfamily subfamily IIIB
MRRLGGLLAVLLVLAVAAGAVAAGAGDAPTTYVAKGGTYTGVRPTAVGLPQVGGSGTVGAGELLRVLRDYHDSGRYDADLARVNGAASAYLDSRLRSWRPKKALAIVLDIDETSLSNYTGLAATGFTQVGNVINPVTATGKAIASTLSLYRQARSRKVAVFFVTGRPPQLAGITALNLVNEGYGDGWAGLYTKPLDAGTEAFKASTRASIESRGYEIVANVGDQESDLDGGHADRAFKLPNPFYFIAD